MKRLVWLGLVGAMALAPLLAQELKYHAGFVKYTVSDDWKVVDDSATGQALTDGTGNLRLEVFCIQRDRGENSRHCLEETAEKKLTDVQYKDMEVFRINDLLQYHITGTGKLRDSGKAVEWSACWVQIEGQNPDRQTITSNTVFWFQGESILASQRDTMLNIYNSIAQDK
jgi:hypothetical protein